MESATALAERLPASSAEPDSRLGRGVYGHLDRDPFSNRRTRFAQ